MAHLLLAFLGDDEKEHLTAVARLGDRLPEKERLLACVWTATAPEMGRGCFSKLAERYADDKIALYFAGSAAIEDGQFDLAKERLERALSFDPAFWPALSDLIPLLAGAGRSDQGLALASRAAELHPSAITFALLGEAHAARGELEAALRAVQRSGTFPGLMAPATAVVVGRVLFFSGRTADAEAALQPWEGPEATGRPAVIMQLIQVRAAEGRLGEALGFAEQLRRLPGFTREDYLSMVGASHLAAWDLAGAAKAWKPGSASPPVLAYVGNLGLADTEAGRLPRDSWRLDLYQGILAWRLGRLDAGADYLRRALVKNSELPQAHFWLGEMSAEAGRHADAVRDFRRFLSSYFVPRGFLRWALQPRALILLSRSELALGHRAEARAAVDRFLDDWKRADPGLPMLAEAKALREQIGDQGR